MQTEWERDAAFHARLKREYSLTPYAEVLRWRRRAMAAWVVCFVLAVALLIALPMHR